ncbi:MAG: LLM class F420-dependent oxidoreductase [Candidatus Rokubacteria bacterium]|nr:LLM class F420-dependent oxidoreductase [Candidatus Rokubacteria bacterium]
MNFGFSLPGRGPLAKPDLILKLAQKADQLGYSSLFVTDHVVLPTASASAYPYHPTGQFPGGARQDYLEPLTLISYLAAATKKIRLGTSVLVVPYRNPLVTAKMLATLDVLSRGRLILGCGVGWLREEFAALAAPPFGERGKVTDEYLRLMRECWSKDEIQFHGRYYRVSDIVCLPKPIQKPGIPIWIGGHTDGALRRAGELGDGWHPIGLRPPALLHPSEYAEKVKQIHAWAARAGRNPKSIALTFRAPMEVWPNRAKPPAGDRQLFRGTAEQVIADIREYQALGVTHFVFDPTAPDPKAHAANMERFAEDVRPRVRRSP